MLGLKAGGDDAEEAWRYLAADTAWVRTVTATVLNEMKGATPTEIAAAKAELVAMLDPADACARPRRLASELYSLRGNLPHCWVW